MEDCSFDARRPSIADVSSFENDFLIDSSLSRLSFAHPSPSPGPGLPDHLDESPKFAEQEGSKNVQNNLRKSLAWDEFFNGPGVLEPDELTSMIESAEKTEKSALPKIHEARQKSTDSKSELVSESLEIASLKNGFSEDTRASVQRSGKASRVENSSGKGKARSVISESHTNQSPKKKELASHGKLKPKPSSMSKLSVGTPKSGKAANPLTIHPRVLQLRNSYSGGQSDSTPSKPPRPEAHSPIVSSTKSNSKAEKKNTDGAAGRRASSSKIQPSSFSHSMILPGPAASRSASSPTAAKKAMNSSADSFVSAASVDSFVSASSSRTIKSAAVITEPKRSSYASVLKKPAPPRTSTATSIDDWSSKSTSSIPTTMQRSKSSRASIAISSLNTPPRASVTSKQSSDGKMLSGQKTRLAAPSQSNGRSASMGGRGTNSVKASSASQVQPQMQRSSSVRLSSSTILPAGSSLDWSMRSTSSLSTTKPRSSSATPRMGLSHQREAAPGPLKSPKPSNDQQLEGQKTKISARPAQHVRSASTGKLVLKPSELRMPSPKIGFFDGVKSGKTPKGTKQPSNLVPGKSGAKTADANESITKVKFGSIPSPRSTMTSGSKKAEKNKQSRSPKEPSSSAEKVSGASSQLKIQDSKSGKRNANKEGGSTVRSRDKESPSEVQIVKNPAAKMELASNELVKNVDPSQKVSEISYSEVSSSTLSAKADQSTGGGRMPFAAIQCNKDASPAGLTGLAQGEKRNTIMSSSPDLDNVESSR